MVQYDNDTSYPILFEPVPISTTFVRVMSEAGKRYMKYTTVHELDNSVLLKNLVIHISSSYSTVLEMRKMPMMILLALTKTPRLTPSRIILLQ